jgi:hypothetical protein
LWRVINYNKSIIRVHIFKGTVQRDFDFNSVFSPVLWPMFTYRPLLLDNFLEAPTILV